MLDGRAFSDSSESTTSLRSLGNGVGMQMLVNTGSMTRQLEDLVQSAIVVVQLPFRTPSAQDDATGSHVCGGIGYSMGLGGGLVAVINRRALHRATDRLARGRDQRCRSLCSFTVSHSRVTSSITIVIRWEPSTFREVMTHPERSVWDNLEMKGIQTTRHIHSIFALDAPELKTHLGEMEGHEEWLLGREYILERFDHRICSLIEVLPRGLNCYAQ